MGGVTQEIWLCQPDNRSSQPMMVTPNAITVVKSRIAPTGAITGITVATKDLR